MIILQRFFKGLLVVFILIGFGIAAGCTSPVKPSAAPPTTAGVSGPVEKVEVFHFHGNQQCASCIAVGDLAEETVNENFKDELASGRLVFAHVNAEQPENADLAEKYGVTGSSLWIGVHDINGFHKEQDIRVWYLINNRDAYSTYLTGLIAKRLNGDLT
jgi:thiol-disulfide isomerase/thioredoxin